MRKQRKRPLATAVWYEGELFGVSIWTNTRREFKDGVVGILGAREVERLVEELQAILREARGT